MREMKYFFVGIVGLILCLVLLYFLNISTTTGYNKTIKEKALEPLKADIQNINNNGSSLTAVSVAFNYYLDSRNIF